MPFHTSTPRKQFCSPDHVGVVDANNMVYGRALYLLARSIHVSTLEFEINEFYRMKKKIGHKDVIELTKSVQRRMAIFL